MIYELVPIELHDELNKFRHDLEKMASQHIEVCPFCQQNEFYLIRSKPTNTYRCKACDKYFNVASNTSFNRLSPFDWLETIFTSRIANKSYQTIAKKLGCTLEKVMRRDQAIVDHLKSYYPLLNKWYTGAKQLKITPTLTKQHQILIEKVTSLLNEQSPVCLYCSSTETTKVGKRTCYRCKRCRRSFNILSDTILNRLPKSELWIEFINLLVSGKNNMQIQTELGFNGNTVNHWRNAWCEMMKRWNLEDLANWCQCH